jgi:IS4 transposase
VCVSKKLTTKNITSKHHIMKSGSIKNISSFAMKLLLDHLSGQRQFDEITREAIAAASEREAEGREEFAAAILEDVNKHLTPVETFEVSMSFDKTDDVRENDTFVRVIVEKMSAGFTYISSIHVVELDRERFACAAKDYSIYTYQANAAENMTKLFKSFVLRARRQSDTTKAVYRQVIENVG